MTTTITEGEDTDIRIPPVESMETMDRSPATVDATEDSNASEQMPARTAPPPFPIVGIGASAGGLAAFEAFFSAIPPDIETGMAFVLVQHLAPDHKSILTELVKRYTRMQVQEVEDGMRVEPDCAYIIPPSHDMALFNGTLRLLEPTAPRGLRLPIDFFFRSLAQDQHERAICVVLSGTGSDGTLGARAIKGEGGLVIAQSPKTAAYDGMPRSLIASGHADYVLPPEEMPAHLIAYAAQAFGKSTRPVAPSAKSEDALTKICILLRDKTRHDFSQYKETTLRRRIERRMALHRIDRQGDYVGFLRQDPAEIEALFSDLLIGVTSFFRDPDAFAALEAEVIPRLFHDKPAGATVRVWVCGCSTGEEAYSIAILLREHLETLKQAYRVQVFATDIDPRAIAQARTGLYPSSISADVSAERLARFFSEDPQGGYRVQKVVRDLLIFSEQDLVQNPPFSRMDLISCRNLLIYLNGDLQARLIALFHYALNPNGVLFLGNSETVGEVPTLFALLNRKWKLYSRLERPRGAFVPTTVMREPPPASTSDQQPLPPAAAGRNKGKLDLRALTEQALLRHCDPVGILVNGRGEILHIYGRTGQYLEPAPGDAAMNVFAMAREGLRRDLTTALHRAVTHREPVRRAGLRVKTNGDYSRVDLTVRPEQMHLDGIMLTDFYLVVLETAAPQLAAPGSTAAGAAGDAPATGDGENARIAEIVLWIGYLQWHFRTYGKVNPPEPVLRDFHNIEHRDALIDSDAVELVRDADGRPVTRWDGITEKISPITGEKIPDETARVEQLRYLNPRKAEWPQADYIVGNPPFIGASTMRRALGDGYVDAVRRTWPEVPESADFVMHWWHIAAEQVRAGAAKRFGFITTNSIRQTFNRRVMQAQLEAKDPLSLAFAIPDHPWVDAADGAQVRIAMTVGTAGEQEGRLLLVREQSETEGDEWNVALAENTGALHADLRIGANIADTKALLANSLIANRGVQLLASGFLVTAEEVARIDPQSLLAAPYRNGKDVTDRPRGLFVLDTYPMDQATLLQSSPTTYQWLLDRSKPERDQNPRASYRENWWLLGENQPLMRKSILELDCFVVTPITARHRMFTFLEAGTMPDQALLVVATEDANILGVLSSRLHVVWALAAGGRLGVGNDPRYNKTRCFETFPFPDATPEQQTTIRALAEQLDAHRKRQQAAHPALTLTGMYNVLEKLRAGATLTDKDKTIHTQGLVSVLRELHDNLDRAVFAAYGWDDLAERLVGLPGATTPLPDKPAAQTEAEEDLLRRLVALNAERAAEESRGRIRWLRPAYQNPGAETAPEQTAADLDTQEGTGAGPTAKFKKRFWPKGMREQIAAVRQTLGREAMTLDALSAHFTAPGTTRPLIVEALAALEELGMVEHANDGYRMAG